MNLCILIPLLVGLLSALLGYLLGKLTSRDDSDASGDIDFWRSKNAQLETDLAACKSKLSEGAGNIPSAAFVASAAPAAAIAFDSASTKMYFGKTIKQDDLTLVEGIGPKIRELFHNHNVSTWKALADTTVARCQEILDTGGERYSVHNPGTWPRQSEMAYLGKWKELKAWQDILDHGKE